jgi:hypothetical protein
MKRSYILLFFSIAQMIYAQVAIGKTTVNSSAALEISESTKGFFFPE